MFVAWESAGERVARMIEGIGVSGATRAARFFVVGKQIGRGRHLFLSTIMLLPTISMMSILSLLGPNFHCIHLNSMINHTPTLFPLPPLCPPKLCAENASWRFSTKTGRTLSRDSRLVCRWMGLGTVVMLTLGRTMAVEPAETPPPAAVGPLPVTLTLDKPGYVTAVIESSIRNLPQYLC